MLDVFLDSDKTSITVSDFGFDLSNDEQIELYVFHLRILSDKGLVEGEHTPERLGINILSYLNERIYELTEAPIRLTSAGHEFASNLNNPEVWDTMKGRIKDEGFAAVVDAAKELGISYLKKKFGLND